MNCKYCNDTGTWVSPIMGTKYRCKECKASYRQPSGNQETKRRLEEIPGLTNIRITDIMDDRELWSADALDEDLVDSAIDAIQHALSLSEIRSFMELTTIKRIYHIGAMNHVGFHHQLANHHSTC